MLQIADIITRVRSLTHDKAAIGYRDDEVLKAVNGGMRFIRRLIKDHRPMLIAEPAVIGTLPAGQSCIELAFYPTKILDLRVDGGRISPIDLAYIDDLRKPGRPQAYYMTAFNLINLYPVPDRDVSFSILAVGDVKELGMRDASPFPGDFDDFLIEYAITRLSLGNEFDMSQETSIMLNIYNQIQSNLIGADSAPNAVSGYWNPLPREWDYIKGLV